MRVFTSQKNLDNIEGFFGDEAFVKLNFAFSAYLLANPNEYEAYYQQIEIEVNLLLPDESEQMIHEIIRLCFERNYIFRCLHGDLASVASVELSPVALKALLESGYLPKEFLNGGPKKILLGLDDLTAEGVREKLESLDRKPSIFNLTQIMQMYRGRYQLNPMTARSFQDEKIKISEENHLA